MKREENVLGRMLRLLALPLAAALLLMGFAGAVNGLDRDSREESKRQLEEALRRGCVACYAAEGAYPPTLEYLQQHYGVQIDSSRYTVHYDIFAENLMPDITILENQP